MGAGRKICRPERGRPFDETPRVERGTVKIRGRLQYSVESEVRGSSPMGRNPADLKEDK